MKSFNAASSYLLGRLRQEAVLHGDFTLASGQKSDTYLDCRRVTFDNEFSRVMAAEIGRTLQKAGIRYYSIGGPATAAAPIAAALSNWTWEQAALLRNQQVPDEWGVRRGPPAPWFLVRSSPKDHGTRQQIEGCVRGEGVILVDDVLTTGKSLIQAIDVLDREEYFVAGVFVLVARGSSAELEIRLESHQSRFGASDGEVFSLFDIEDILL